MATIPFADAKGRGWSIQGTKTADGKLHLDADQLQLVLLQEVRNELQTLNSLLHCPNLQAIPRKLDEIRLKLPTRKKRARKA